MDLKKSYIHLVRLGCKFAIVTLQQSEFTTKSLTIKSYLIMSEIYQLPDNGNNNGTNIPFSIPIGLVGMNNGFGFGNGMNGIYDLLGVAIIASLFGWNNGGFGGFGGGFGGASPSVDYLKKTLDEKDFETTEDENKVE